jgi:DNA-binding beta-propeller fold protein YncE
MEGPMSSRPRRSLKHALLLSSLLVGAAVGLAQADSPTIPLASPGAGIAIDSVAGRAYVNLQTPAVAVIDTSTETVVSTATLVASGSLPADRPDQVVADSARGVAYVTDIVGHIFEVDVDGSATELPSPWGFKSRRLEAPR